MMTHFGFAKQPFTRGLASGKPFPSAGFSEALARLHYALSERLFTVLTGEPGSGKSTVLKAFQESLDPAKHLFIYVHDLALKTQAFYWTILSELGVLPVRRLTQNKRMFRKALADALDVSSEVVIAIDEAHCLPVEMFQELRSILNFNLDSMNPLTLILTGESELGTTFRLRAFRGVAQRVGMKYHLEGLSLEETGNYVNHHTETAGVQAHLFPEDVIRSVHSHSNGIPRVIDRICLAALLDASSTNKSIVDAEALQNALKEIQF